MSTTVQFPHVDGGDALQRHLDASGQGPPVLLLHGFTGASGTWAALRTVLGARYATLAPDLPGHGSSAAPADPARYTLDRFTGDLARRLDALGIEQTAVLGYSLGGRAALRFALAYPDRIAALVLESASPGIVDPVERAARVRADEALARTIEREGVAAFVKRWEQLPLWASQVALPEAARRRLRAERLANTAVGLANSLRGAGVGVDEPVLAQLATVHAPTLLTVGALDPKYVALGRTMAQMLPAAQLAIVADAGHAVHLERPDAFAALVTTFLDAVPRTAERAWDARARLITHNAEDSA